MLQEKLNDALDCTQKSAQILGGIIWQRRLHLDDRLTKSPRLLRCGLGRWQEWLYLHHWLSVISWQHAYLLELSKKQRFVARSSTEADYKALADMASELLWVLSLFTKLGHTSTANPVIYCDNLGATHLIVNPVFHSRMKHIALTYHFVQENVQHGKFRVSFVSTDDQLVDILPKPLLRSRFDYLLSKLRLSFRPYNLRQDINNNN